MSADCDTPNFILTHSGVKFDFLDPDPESVVIEDIAHALSQTVRWGGHCQQPMTVAQHSVIVSRLVEEAGAWEGVQLYALLHDASEAYLPDMPSPVKRHLPDYKRLEKVIQSTVLTAFGVSDPHGLYREITHAADIEAYRWEARDLLIDGGRGMIRMPDEEHEPLVVMSPRMARAEFLWRFNGLRAVIEEN